MPDAVRICILSENDPAMISNAFRSIGWGKPVAQYQRYLAEQTTGSRVCFVARADGQFAGYVTVNWTPTYPGFAKLKVPEIQDLNVVPGFRRRGIGSRLLDRAEEEIALRCRYRCGPASWLQRSPEIVRKAGLHTRRVWSDLPRSLCRRGQTCGA